MILSCCLLCDIRLDHVRTMSVHVKSSAGCDLNTSVSCVKIIAEIRDVCSFLTLASLCIIIQFK
jgi:hypothetical protein